MIASLRKARDRIPTAFGYVGRSARAAACLPAIAAMSAGCAIRPVQEDVTGVQTHQLVQYIRCETRLAIQDKAIKLLREENPGNPLLVDMDAGRGQPWPLTVRARMNAHERLIYDKYIDTGIAYDFTFDITENNSVVGFADPVRLITNGTAGVGVSASGIYNRQNARHFVVSETARSLLQNTKLECASEYRGSIYTYPISGNIGMEELISRFFELNEVKDLTPDKTTSSVFADTLTFTTSLIGSASPHVVIAPVGNKWGLAPPTSLNAGASRIDKHMLIIGLSRDKPKAPSVAAAAVVPGYTAGRSALQRDNVKSKEEQSALDAVRQARLDSYLDRAAR